MAGRKLFENESVLENLVFSRTTYFVESKKGQRFAAPPDLPAEWSAFLPFKAV